MKLITRIIFVYFLVLSCVSAERLNIKVGDTAISLPYWQAKTPNYGAVLIVRGGEQPQWSVLLAKFAKQLAHYGWSVVLLNCTQDNSVPWIEQLPKAISTLRQDKNSRIVLVHYGDQLNQSLEYFSKPQSKMVNGLVMISAYDDQSVLAPLPKLRFPLFDIAGQFDFDRVLRQMNQREKEFKQQHYVSLEMPGARHDYEYSQKLLLSFVHGWMSKLPANVIESSPILVSYIEPPLVSVLPTFSLTN